MLHHVTLLKPTRPRVPWRLIGPDGTHFAAFEAFAVSLMRKHHKSTREAYCRHVAYFIDYLLEFAGQLLARGEQVMESDIMDAIDAYDDYLVLGGSSGREIAAQVNSTRPSRHVSGKSSAAAHAAIRKFLKLSERFRSELVELSNAAVLCPAVPPSPTSLIAVGGRTAASDVQRSAIAMNSMLASVVAGGAKLVPSAELPTAGGVYKYDASRAFPFDRIADFIDYFTTHRDKVLYALLAGTGCRIHEALQVLFEDINLNTREISLVDPGSRRNHDSYLRLTAVEHDALCWKGREKSSTFFIEPFASIFFDELERYLASEYLALGNHLFVFQTLTGPDAGRPYFASDASNRRKIFKKAVKRAGIHEPLTGPHTLRHAYGTYLVNYFPLVGNEYGLSLPVVQQVMGHKNIRYTAIYARHDEDLLRQELEYANAMVYSGAMPKSLLDMKLQALYAQVKILETQLSDRGH